MKLSVIIPCFNEEKTISDLINAVKNSGISNQEIIVVDDCSTDGSKNILKNLKNEDIKLFFHSSNKGKGAALRTGFKQATGDICIVQDADLEYDPKEYSLMIEPIIANKADVVFGSRFQGAEPHRVVYFWHRVGNGFLTLLSNIMTDINLTDMETCYKAFRTEILKSINIKEKRFGFEPEITAKISKKNYLNWQPN